jgi:uncharacterized membrane protein YccC
MAYTLRNVSRLAHTPLKEKLLKCGETNRGIGSVKKMAQEAAKRKAAEAELARMIAARNRNHQQALENGAAAAAERERRKAAEWVLKEIRIRLHAAGRRPEECWEMSEIDGHLAQFERHKD